MPSEVYISSLNVANATIVRATLDKLNTYFTGIRGAVLNPEDSTDSDLRRIREVNTQTSTTTPENKEHLPFLVVTPIEYKATINKPSDEKYKLTLTRNNTTGVSSQTLFRLLDANYKAKIYVTNYKQALLLLEYFYCTINTAIQYSMENPHFLQTFEGRISLSNPTISKVTDLLNKGIVYVVTISLSSNIVITIPQSAGKIILNPIGDAIHSDPQYGLERIDMSSDYSFRVIPL